MTPEEDPFIAAIAADPADEVVRLVYSDWLEERGEDARAAYLRAEAAHFRASAAERRNDEWCEMPGVDPIWAAMVSRTEILVTGLTFSDTGPKLMRADLKAIEDHWGHPLPPDYAAFLLLYNGGRPSKPYLWSYLDGEDFYDEVRFFSTCDTRAEGGRELLSNPGEILLPHYNPKALARFERMMPIGTLTYAYDDYDDKENILALVLGSVPPLEDRLVEIEWSQLHGLRRAEDVHAKETFASLLHALVKGPSADELPTHSHR